MWKIVGVSKALNSYWDPPITWKSTTFSCSLGASNNFRQETLCPSHTDLLAPRVCARGRLREKAVKLLHGRGTLRLCPSDTDLVTLTRLCKSEASVKLLHGLGPRGHVMPVSHGLASGSMHIHEPVCFISLVYEFWREDYSILATYSLEFVLLPPVVKVWFWNVIVPIRGWVVWESSSPHCTNFMKIIYIYTFNCPIKTKGTKRTSLSS